MTEAELRAQVAGQLADLETARRLIWHSCADSRKCQGSPGFPDLLIATARGVLARELKSETGDTTAAQDLWAWTLNEPARARGIPPLVSPWAVWRPRHLEDGLVAAELAVLCAP